MAITDFQYSYEISPIMLTGGSSSSLPGGGTPIVSLLQPDAFSGGITSSGYDMSFDDYFAHFVAIPGSKLTAYEVGEYPFANQAVAANAMIALPTSVSLLMICPVQGNGWADKQSRITSTISAIDAHVLAGGTFLVATPAFIWSDALLLDVVDVSDGDSKQVQVAFQWNFYKPLLSQADAETAYNNAMSKWASGTPVDGDPPSWSGTAPTVGNPASLAAPSLVPAATGLSGANVSGLTPQGVSGFIDNTPGGFGFGL